MFSTRHKIFLFLAVAGMCVAASDSLFAMRTGPTRREAMQAHHQALKSARWESRLLAPLVSAQQQQKTIAQTPAQAGQFALQDVRGLDWQAPELPSRGEKPSMRISHYGASGLRVRFAGLSLFMMLFLVQCAAICTPDQYYTHPEYYPCQYAQHYIDEHISELYAFQESWTNFIHEVIKPGLIPGQDSETMEILGIPIDLKCSPHWTKLCTQTVQMSKEIEGGSCAFIFFEKLRKTQKQFNDLSGRYNEVIWQKYKEAHDIIDKSQDVVAVVKELDPAFAAVVNVFLKQSWKEYAAQSGITIRDALNTLKEFEAKTPEWKAWLEKWMKPYKLVYAIYEKGKDVAGVAEELDPALAPAFNVFFTRTFKECVEYFKQQPDEVNNALRKIYEFNAGIVCSSQR